MTKKDLKIINLFVFISLLYFPTLGFGACKTPTSKEITDFFSNKSDWTEVVSQEIYQIAKKKPIRMEIDFRRPANSVAFMGDRKLTTSGVNFCKKGANKLVIKKSIGQITFTKHNSQLITSHDPINGTLYYRRSDKVQEDVTSEILDESLRPENNQAVI